MYDNIKKPVYVNRNLHIIDKRLVYFIILFFVSCGLSYYFATKDRGMWEGAKSYTPSYGSSDILYFFLLFLFQVTFSITAYLSLLHSKTNDERHIILITYTMGLTILCLYYYLTSYSEQRFKAGYHYFVIIFMISLLLLYTCYEIFQDDRRLGEISLWCGVLSVASSLYLTLWIYEVQNNST